jgi:hypothetical protein
MPANNAGLDRRRYASDLRDGWLGQQRGRLGWRFLTHSFLTHIGNFEPISLDHGFMTHVRTDGVSVNLRVRNWQSHRCCESLASGHRTEHGQGHCREPYGPDHLSISEVIFFHF